MINVTKEAAGWFKNELGVQAGQAIRFFARYSAGGTIHPGFSLGIEIENPISPGTVSEVEGIKFFMEDKDLWYLEGYHLNVEYNQEHHDIEYQYELAEGQA
ncbi:HesB/YadR/YfhF family protein [Paenibacillus bouchesdurhonensis]|uniref:HesB/YadR/YfhF family protein n=1 Tax=Paenibacillus bouchesdurhonensis TaxID=1870990 RepID=UPI000DA5FD64|nr:hypothetical protein [Paenibacillus bouchesdurhonensis]